MKKFLAVFALAAVVVSCNNKKSEEKKTDGDTTVVTNPPADNPPVDNPPANTGVPKFADAEVQKYVDDYTAFVQSYIDAYAAKDMTKVQEISGRMTEWTTRSTAISQKLASNPEEAKKFSDYMTALSMKWADAAKAMMPESK